jgi:hypothetical protein
VQVNKHYHITKTSTQNIHPIEVLMVITKTPYVARELVVATEAVGRVLGRLGGLVVRGGWRRAGGARVLGGRGLEAEGNGKGRREAMDAMAMGGRRMVRG